MVLVFRTLYINKGGESEGGSAATVGERREPPFDIRSGRDEGQKAFAKVPSASSSG